MIQLKNLLMRFRDESQISYTNLTFESGKTYALLGASGCGKPTLLNLIAGVLTPREGSVFIDGWDICAATRRRATPSASKTSATSSKTLICWRTCAYPTTSAS